MRKDRFGRYLPIMTAVTAMAIYPAASRARTITENAKSTRNDTSEQTTASRTDASVGTQVNETDPAKMEAGRLIAQKR